MKKELVYKEKSFDILFKNLPKFWSFFKENITIISVVITIIGSFSQVLNLFLLSPSLVNYYSPTQGVLDGVLFLSFFVFVIIAYYHFLLLYFRVKRNPNIRYINYFVIMSLLNWFLIGLIILKLGFYALIPLFLIPGLFLPSLIKENVPTEIIEVSKNPIEERSIESTINKYFFNSAIILIILIFFAFWGIGNTIRKKEIKKIVNFELIENKLNKDRKSTYKIVYTNNEYIFLKDFESNKFIVLKSDEIIKSDYILGEEQ